MRGPVVYCLESADNGDCLDALSVCDPGDYAAETDSTLFPGMTAIVGPAVRQKPWTADALYRRYEGAAAEKVTIRAIPYAFWDNREDTREMIVWVRKA